MKQPKYQWKAERAYIMESSLYDSLDKEDIRIVQIPDARPFFNRKELKDENLLGQANLFLFVLRP